MSYFVTGATGFIGRHLVEKLLERDGDIHVLVREGSREFYEPFTREGLGAKEFGWAALIPGLSDPDPRGANNHP